MAHIHTGDGEHDLTVSAFIAHIDEGEAKLMLINHKKLHKLLQPGGHVELNETPWQALAHELKEEAGFDIKDLSILQPRLRLKSLTSDTLHPVPININTHEISDTHNHTDIEYLLIAHKLPSLAPEAGESIDIRWLTLGEIEKAYQDGEMFEGTAIICRFVINQLLNDDSWEQTPAESFSL